MPHWLSLVSSVSLCAVTATATAQEINIDIGDGKGAPVSTYGADAVQPGVWNVVSALSNQAPLVDVAGNVSDISITISGGFDFAVDHTGTLRGDARLMNDLSRGAVQTITLSSTFGVVAPEELFVYAWSPDDSAALSTVQIVNPFTGIAEDVGGAWTEVPSERWGRTYAWSTVSKCDAAFPGDLVIQVSPGPGTNFTSINGLQLVSRQLCFGSFCSNFDGAVASCPCQNRGLPTTGCDNAQGTGGVRLVGIAQETTPLNRATLQGTGFPTMGSPGSVLFRSPMTDVPVVFGDGLRCVKQQPARAPGRRLRDGRDVDAHDRSRSRGRAGLLLLPDLVPQPTAGVLRPDGGVQHEQRLVLGLVLAQRPLAGAPNGVLWNASSFRCRSPLTKGSSLERAHTASLELDDRQS
jgi:hypothetical protein